MLEVSDNTLTKLYNLIYNNGEDGQLDGVSTKYCNILGKKLHAYHIPCQYYGEDCEIIQHDIPTLYLED